MTWTAPVVDQSQAAPSVVYMAVNDEGLLKIGHTKNLKRRMSALKAKVVHQVAGDYWTEQQLLGVIRRAPVRGREWFTCEMELQLEIRTFMDRLTVFYGPRLRKTRQAAA